MDEIAEALDSAMLSLEKYQKVSISVCFLGEQKIQCYDILYFEVYDYVVLMHTWNGKTYHCTESLTVLANKLNKKGFVLTNRSYLVNREYTKKGGQNQVSLIEDISLPLSCGKCTDIRELHFE